MRICLTHRSQSMASGYMDIADGVITAINLGSPPKTTKLRGMIDCKKAMLAPASLICVFNLQTRVPNILRAYQHCLLLQRKAALPHWPVYQTPAQLLMRPARLTLYVFVPRALAVPRLYAYGAATKALAGNEMAELGLMAEAGAVGFTNCTSSIHDSLIMRRLLAYSNMLDKPFIQHCEDHALTREGEMNEGETSTRLGLIGSPSEAEVIIIDRDLHLYGERRHAIMSLIFRPALALMRFEKPRLRGWP